LKPPEILDGCRASRTIFNTISENDDTKTLSVSAFKLLQMQHRNGRDVALEL
jgi:hypothetical protein